MATMKGPGGRAEAAGGPAAVAGGNAGGGPGGRKEDFAFMHASMRALLRA